AKPVPRWLQIRNTVGCSSSQLLRRLGAADSFTPARISEYESGTREPSLWMLLAYGRVARVHVDARVDEDASLPESLPASSDFRRSQRRLVAHPPKNNPL